MAQLWQAKTPGEVKRFAWPVPVLADDSLVSFTVTASGATVDSQGVEGNDAVVYVSGGTASTVASFTFSATTDNGETIQETIYLPILPTSGGKAHSETAQTIIDYALKPITGVAGTPTSAERTDALEHLNGMLGFWRDTGADVGAALPVGLSDSLYAPDDWILAIKNNLRVYLAEQYGQPITPVLAALAKIGLQGIKNSSLREIENAPEGDY